MLAFVSIFDSSLFLYIKRKKDNPLQKCSIVCIIAVALITCLIGGVAGRSTTAFLERILINLLFVSVIIIKFFSYIAPRKQLTQIKGD